MVRASWPNYASRALCLAFGVWVTMGLTHGLKPATQWLPKPRPVKVAVRAVVAPAPAAKAATVPAPAPAKPRAILPLRVENAPAPKPVEPPKPAPDAVAAPAAPEVVQAMPTPTLEQPPLDLAANVPVLPPVPGAQVPEAPSNAPVQLNNYPEQPGGPVLVLELTVNDQGLVEDSRILVPSYNTLGDLSLALASRGQRWTGLTPPLQPGERRKLEIRIPYGEDGVVAPPQTTLP